MTGTRFGDYLRAARLGFHQLPKSEPPIYMRIEPWGTSFWKIQFAWNAKQMGELVDRYGRKHVVWWEGDYNELVLSSPVLRKFLTTRIPCELILDDKGEEVSA